MIITNDVALITFVPFTFVVLDLMGQKLRQEWILPVVCMQTIAANSPGSEVVVSVMASQIISNVPAALLLSGFTDQTSALIVGTNLGGLGTLIASMASLISFRQIARGESERKGKYFILFTISNILFLMVLLIIYWRC